MAASTATATATSVMPPPHLSAPDTKGAMMAAATCGPPKDKHRPAPFKDLNTPLSAHPPIQSPLTTGTPTWMKRDAPGGNMKTPVTPPSAYLDFLKAMSPGMGSPLSTGASTHFSFTAGARSPAFFAATPKSASFPIQPLSARPSLPTQLSNASSASSTSSAPSAAGGASSDNSTTAASAPAPAAANAANSSRRLERTVPVPPSPALPPPPASAATVSGEFPATASSRPGPPPRRPSLIIPESPTSSTFQSATLSGTYTPISAIRSPTTKSVLSPVIVRHVVTRTITYTRRAPPASAHPATASQFSALAAAATPVEKGKERARASSQPLVGEAPKGKKRKVN